MLKQDISYMLDKLITEVEDDGPESLRSALATAFRCGVLSPGLRFESDADLAEACGLPRASDLSVDD